MENSVKLIVRVPNHTLILLVCPSSLEELYSEIASISNKPESSISSLFYSVGSAWVKITSNNLYLSAIRRIIACGEDEIEMKVEFIDIAPENARCLRSNDSHIISEDAIESSNPKADSETDSSKLQDEEAKLRLS